jgi:RNA polymerase sigma-70 factor, ECF subfamily
VNPPVYPSPSDQEFFELLTQARAGSKDALGQLIDRYRPYLMKLAHDEGDTDLQAKEGDSDVVQDACAKACQTFLQFQGGTSGEMRGWLRKILLSKLGDLRDQYFAFKRDVRAEVSLQDLADADSRNAHLEAATSSPSEYAVRNEERDMLEAALQHLTDDERAIIEMRQKEGRPFSDIARQLHLTEDAAQKRWARAIHSLQEKVRRLYDPTSG